MSHGYIRSIGRKVQGIRPNPLWGIIFTYLAILAMSKDRNAVKRVSFMQIVHMIVHAWVATMNVFGDL